MRLISWNVNRAVRRVEKQVAALLDRNADVIALQEVSGESIDRYKEGLKGEFPHFSDSSKHAKGLDPEGRKRCFVSIASKWQLQAMTNTRYAVPSAEHKFLSVVARIKGKDLEIHTAHVPSGSDRGREWRKVRTLQGVYASLRGSNPRYRILCGDFNCPRAEGPGGEIESWGRKTTDQYGKEITKDDWIKAEENVLRGLEEYDLIDVFRKPAGKDGSIYKGRGYSWQGRGKERRYDHVLASMALRPVQCIYIHDYETPPNRLSDHALVEAVFGGI